MHEIVALDQIEEEAALKGQLELLVHIGRKQLGTPDEKARTALARITDTNRILKMADAMPMAKSWKVLLAVK